MGVFVSDEWCKWQCWSWEATTWWYYIVPFNSFFLTIITITVVVIAYWLLLYIVHFKIIKTWLFAQVLIHCIFNGIVENKWHCNCGFVFLQNLIALMVSVSFLMCLSGSGIVLPDHRCFRLSTLVSHHSNINYFR